MLSFIKFGGQTSTYGHDVRKVCLEMIFCVLPCFIKFYVLVLDEIDVVSPKLVYINILVRNVWENIPMYHPRVLKEEHMLVAKTSSVSPTYG